MAIAYMTEEAGKSLLIDQLAARAQAGCQESFGQLVDQYHKPIYHFIYQMTRNAHDAEDLTQETFIRACQHVSKYNCKFKFSTWLFTIARNCTVTHFRKQQRIDKTVQAEWQQAATAQENSEIDGPDQTIWLRARELKPKHFEALWLHYHQGFSVREIASIMGSNVVYVKVLLHRARHALGTKLKAGKNEL